MGVGHELFDDVRWPPVGPARQDSVDCELSQPHDELPGQVRRAGCVWDTRVYEQECGHCVRRLVQRISDKRSEVPAVAVRRHDQWLARVITRSALDHTPGDEPREVRTSIRNSVEVHEGDGPRTTKNFGDGSPGRRTH